MLGRNAKCDCCYEDQFGVTHPRPSADYSAEDGVGIKLGDMIQTESGYFIVVHRVGEKAYFVRKPWSAAEFYIDASEIISQ